MTKRVFSKYKWKVGKCNYSKGYSALSLQQVVFEIHSQQVVYVDIAYPKKLQQF